jgi:hypothetical protein
MRHAPFKTGDYVVFSGPRVEPFLGDEVMIVEGLSRLTLRGQPPVWRVAVKSVNRFIKGTMNADVLEKFENAASNDGVSPGDSHERAAVAAHLKVVR